MKSNAVRHVSNSNFSDRLIKSILSQHSYLCVGLDPQLRYIPLHIRKEAVRRFGPGLTACAEAIIAFNRTIIDVTVESAACFKPQSAFYERYGVEGIRALECTKEYARSTGLPVILDCKREDGGDTSEAYADTYLGMIDMLNEDGGLYETFGPLNFDAITITPWIDGPNFDPFVDAARQFGTGAFVVTKTSFKPASRLQDSAFEKVMFGNQDSHDRIQEIGRRMDSLGVPRFWMALAEIVRLMGLDAIGENGYSSIGVVMGATYPEDAEIMKAIIPNAFKLVPGFKAQGGRADEAVVSVNDDGFGFVANSSRGTNYAYHAVSKSQFQRDPRFFATASALEAKEERDALNESVFKRLGKLAW